MPQAASTTTTITRAKARSLSLLAILLASWMLSLSACALDRQRALYQYAHSVWRTQDGNFDGTPSQVMQDADGYIWVGTSMGLTRLNGESFASPNADLTRNIPSVNTLLLDRNGTIWVGGPGGLQAIRQGRLLQVSSWKAEIHSLLQARDGRVWVTRLRIRDGKGPLCEVVGSDLLCHGPEHGIADKYATALAEDEAGAKWFGSSAMSRWHDGTTQEFLEKQLKAVSGGGSVRYLLAQPGGSVLAALDIMGTSGGLQQYAAGRWTSFEASGLHGSSVAANVLFVDREGALWVGTVDQGLYRIWNGKADRFTVSDGLSGDQVNDVREDAEGNIWVATVGGVDCFRDILVADFTPHRGLTRSLGGPVLARTDGTVWIAEKGGIDVWRDGSLAPLKADIGQSIHAFYEDKAHRVWIAVDNRLLLYDRGRVRAIRTKEKGAPSSREESILSIAQDRPGRLWAIATRSGSRTLLQIDGDQVVRTLDLPAKDRTKWLVADDAGGLWLGANSGELSYLRDGERTFVKLPTQSHSFGITDLRVLPDGALLVSTGIGLFVKKQDRWRVLDQDHGLPCSAVYSTLVDGEGSVWMFGACGLLKVTKADFEQLWQNERFRVQPRMFGRFDGVFPGDQDAQPRATASLGGKLWFTNGVVLQMVDPRDLRVNQLSPPVHIDAMTASGRKFPVAGDVRLPSNVRDLEIAYSGLSYVQPKQVQFRYRLEGHNDTWQQVVSRRRAFYTSLAPGRYRFQVVACNNDGVWNTSGAGVDLTVAAAFYQTLWFKLLTAALLAVCLWIFYTVRLQQASKAVRGRLLTQMAERERIARDLHDTFFQGIQGLLLRFQTATSQLPKQEPSRAIFEQVLLQSDAVMLEGRELVLDLRHEEDNRVDLAGLFAKAAEEFQQHSPIHFRLLVNGRVTSLHPIVFDELHRLGREALFNAFRHSKANSVEVELDYTATELGLRFRDDGIGIEPATIQSGGLRGHWGLPGMHERAERIGAQLNVWSRRNAGTEVDVHVPAAVAYQRQSHRSLIWRLWQRFTSKKEGNDGLRVEADSRYGR